MSSTTVDIDAPTITPGEVARLWVRHLVSLIFPVSALAFLLTGPHSWYVAPVFLIPLGIIYHLDIRAKVERRQPVADLPAWPFDAIVYALTALHFVIVFELARMFSTQAIFSIDMAMVLLMVGANSGFSIITAHELIHRRKHWEQQLGRLLLCTVLYEHFYTEHLRGHHARVGTPEDPATALFGESFNHFFRRTVPRQFRSAWRLEAKRLGDEEMSLWDSRMFQSRILHGIVVEWGIAFAILLTFGLTSFVAFLLQAFMAVRLLEAVNYFEHWGLRRRTLRVQPVDSWDTHSWFTYYGLTGLSRHADHHAFPTRPFQQLRVWEEAPVLPAGYVGMVDMVLIRNEEFRRSAVLELERRQLGPFTADSDAEEKAAATALAADARAKAAEAPAEDGAATFFARWRHALVIAAGVVLVATLGGQLETGTLAGVFGAFFRNAWVLAVFAGALVVHAVLQRRTESEALSWAGAFLALVAVGSFTDYLLG